MSDKSCVFIMSVILLSPFYITYHAIADGFVLSKFWEWFLVPVFNIGVPALGLCIGICATAGFLFKHKDFDKLSKSLTDDEEEKPILVSLFLIFLLIFGPWITLGFGYLIYLFGVK